jgi:hypothetical protein
MTYLVKFSNGDWCRVRDAHSEEHARALASGFASSKATERPKITSVELAKFDPHEEVVKIGPHPASMPCPSLPNGDRD